MEPRVSAPILPMILFATATVASWIYCISTGHFNGDFWPREITISNVTLTIALFAAITPYFLVWQLNKRFSARTYRHGKIFVPKWFLELLFLSVFFWHITVTIAFHVGVMDQDFYNAPNWIKPLIQVGNRIDPFFIGTFYILASLKNWKNDSKAIVFMIALGFLRAGLGVFAYIIIALSIKYRIEFLRFFKRRFPFLLILLIAAPYVINSLYDIRSSLRGEAIVTLAVSDLVVAKLAGRLSSYSNLAYIIQESPDFEVATHNLPVFYYPLQIAGSILDGRFTPSVTPEKLLIDVNLFYDGNSTYMASVPGNLLLAWFVSPLVAVFNLVLILAMVMTTLKIANRFGNGESSSIGIAMLLYPLTSGVSYEFAVLLVNIIVIYFLGKAVGGMHLPLRVNPNQIENPMPADNTVKVH